MRNLKIEPRLEEEVKQSEAAAQPQRKIPVIIKHIKEVEILPGKDPRVQLDELEQQVRDLQRGITVRLSELGVDEVHQATMSNALSAHLTPAQINEISVHGDVKFIRLNREEQVTA